MDFSRRACQRAERAPPLSYPYPLAAASAGKLLALRFSLNRALSGAGRRYSG
jgi:hypothetical protein